MALDPVPWFVGKGARHSAAAARNLAWNATGGKTGISTPESLLVRELPTPGGGVQIMPGGGVIDSVYGGAMWQSYTVRNAEADTVEIPANTSGSTRTYRITVEVVDPTYAGEDPESVENGPYNFFRVRTTRQYSHPELLLAKVDVPPGASVITDSMIRDMRELANPRREELVFGRPRVSEDSEAGQYLNALREDGGEYFPGGSGSPNTFEVTVPRWANRVMIDADWMSVNYLANTNPWGSYWVEFGDEYKPHTWPHKRQYEFATQQFSFNSPGKGNNNMRMNWPLMDSVSVPQKLRGEKVTFCFKAGLATADGKGAVFTDGGSGVGCRLTFVEVPDSNPDIV